MAATGGGDAGDGGDDGGSGGRQRASMRRAAGASIRSVLRYRASLSHRGSRGGVQAKHGQLAVEAHRRSLCQRARAPHAYFAAPVRGCKGREAPLRGGARQDLTAGYVLQSASSAGRVESLLPGFTGAYHHRRTPITPLVTWLSPSLSPWL